jgi:hypothetical protein
VLDFALDNSPSNCERFIQQNGLKAVFPAFMGKGLKGKVLFFFLLEILLTIMVFPTELRVT